MLFSLKKRCFRAVCWHQPFPQLDPGRSCSVDQCTSAEFLKWQNLSGRWEGSLCAGTELLFLSGGLRCLSNWLFSGSGGFVEIQLFLLYNRFFDSVWRAAWSFYMWISMPIWLVPGSAAQNSREKAVYKKAEAADVFKICGASSDRMFLTCICGQ